jgi:hypothetical protein
LEAFVKNNKLGNCYLLESQEIKGKAYSIIIVEFVCPVLDLIQTLGVSIADLLKNKKLKIDFQGNAGAYNVRVNVNESIEINLPTFFY